MVTEITNKAFRKAMEKAGLGEVELLKDGCYFYLMTEKEESDIDIKVMSIKQNEIMRHSFKDTNIKTWIEEIKELINTVSDDEVVAYRNFDENEELTVNC